MEFQLFNAPANIAILESNITFINIEPGQSTTSEGTLIVRIDRSQPTGLYDIPWRVTLEVGEILGDFTGDGKVDCKDLVRFADKWLWIGQPGSIEEDIITDGIVDFLDFAKLGENWMIDFN